MAAGIDHPNVIPIYDTGLQDDSLYIVMRFVAGGDLKALLVTSGPLSADRRSRVLTPGRPGAGRRARPWPRPPRRQAGEHPPSAISDGRDRARLPERLRRHEAHLVGQRADQDGRAGRHGRLHGARADRGPRRQRADRRLRARLPLLPVPSPGGFPSSARPRRRCCGRTCATTSSRPAASGRSCPRHSTT